AAHIGVGEIGCALRRMVEPFKSGAIGEEGVAKLIPMMAPRIATASAENLETPAIRVEPPDAATVEPHHTVRGLDVRMSIDRLVHIDVTVVSPAQCMQIVMGVFRAEAGEDNRPLVGFPVAIGVYEMQQLVARRDVATSVAVRQNSGRDQQALGKDR